MVVAPSEQEEGLQRLRMSWEEFLDLPDDVRAEWVDGEVVVSPAARPRHGVVQLNIGSLLKAALPDLVVMVETNVPLPHNRLRIPDVTVATELSSTMWVETVPVLVVEVLSPSTRTEDTVRKGPEYAEAGVGQFWIVDPENRSLDVYANVEGRWEPLLHLDERHPTGTVTVVETEVRVDLAQVVPG